MHHRVYILAMAASLGTAATAFAQQVLEEKVVVTASAYPVPFDNLSRVVTVLTRDDIEGMPVRSLLDVLEYAASVDVRSRAPFGLQADLSIRGSAYSQVLVLVNGVRMNDSQTAHHNADFPVQLQEVERIEILHGPGAALYGADALGGIINIITQSRPRPLRASFSAGQFGLAAGSFGVTLRKGKLEQSWTASADRSSGFMYDRDFRSIAFSSRTAFGMSTSLFVSHGNKEFGANGFYGPAPSREWTNQTLVALEHRLGKQADSTTVLQSYYRTHGDRFLYDIRTPGLYENRHRTHAVGVRMKSQWVFSNAFSLSIGGEGGADFIASSNLGDHSFARASLFGELQWQPASTAAVYSGMRYDRYTDFGGSLSPSISGSWWVVPRLRLRSSLAHAFRIPTFTELYYRDPNNEATPTLKPESAWSLDAGGDFLPAQNWLGSITLFLRHERDVIDWIRRSSAERWRTANIRRLKTRGGEISLERSFRSRGRLTLRYTHIGSAAGRIDYSSKYVLDYARHSWSTAGFVSLPLKLSCGQTLSYRRRSDGRSYWVWDGHLERPFSGLIATLDFTNLLDRRYQEVRGVDMPGRWFIFGIRFQFPSAIQ